MAHILVLNGHPDGDEARFCAAIAKAYVDGALEAHQVRSRRLADMDFPLIQTRKDFEDGAPPLAIRNLQDDIRWADHVVIVHPLWLGGAPARLKGLLEQTFRYGFAIGKPGGAGQSRLLKGKSARIICTMGMPSPIFRLVFGAFGVRAIERGVLWLSGFSPIRRSIIGQVESMSPERRCSTLRSMEVLGRAAR